MQQPARSARVRADRVIHHSRLKCPVPEITCLTISPIATAGRAKVAKTAPGAKQSEADIGNIRERCDKAPRRFSPLLCKFATDMGADCGVPRAVAALLSQ